MNFNDKRLVEKHGTWVKVQVEFYDFLFKTAQNLCPHHWKGKALEAAVNDFRGGTEFYDDSVKSIEDHFDSQEDAWDQFVEQELSTKTDLLNVN